MRSHAAEYALVAVIAVVVAYLVVAPLVTRTANTMTEMAIVIDEAGD